MGGEDNSTPISKRTPIKCPPRLGLKQYYPDLHQSHPSKENFHN